MASLDHSSNPRPALYTFCHNIPKFAAEVKALIEDINRLENLVKSVENIAEQNFSSDPSTTIWSLEKDIPAMHRETL